MRVSLDSMSGKDAIPSTECISSRDAGWTSLLVDHHLGIESTEAYTSPPTVDLRIGVALGGRYWSEALRGGRWTRGHYEAGSICLHRRGESVSYRFPISLPSEFSTALIYLPRDRFLGAAEHVRRVGSRGAEPELRTDAGRDPAISAMAGALMAAAIAGADDLYAETAAAWLCVHLLYRHGGGSRPDEVRSAGGITDQRLARTIELMATGFAQSLSLARLAEEACVSTFHFARLFREKTGRTPHRYLRSIRLEAASRMLLSTERRTSEVGFACGFHNASHFSSAFAAEFGLSPSAFRKNAARGWSPDRSYRDRQVDDQAPADNSDTRSTARRGRTPDA